MKAHEVAEHILAKIDEIVQSDDLTPQRFNSSEYLGSKSSLNAYCEALDAVTNWQKEEPQPRRASGSAVSSVPPPRPAMPGY